MKMRTMPTNASSGLREHDERIKALEQDMQATEKRVTLQLKADPQMRPIAQMPGVGEVSKPKLTTLILFLFQKDLAHALRPHHFQTSAQG